MLDRWRPHRPRSPFALLDGRTVCGGVCGRLRADGDHRASLHRRVGRRALRHAPGALPAPAAAVAALLRADVARRHHGARQQRRRRDSTRRGRVVAVLGGNALFLVGSVAALFWLDVRLALVGLALVPVAVWVLSRTRTTLAAHVKNVREASAAIGSFLIETVQAVRLVVTSNAQEREVQRFRGANGKFMRALMAMQLWSYLAGSAPGLVLSAGYVTVFVYGGQRVIGETLTLGTFIAFMAYYMRLFQPVQSLMGLYASIATVEVSLARVHQLLDTPARRRRSGRSDANVRVRGAVEFDGVSVRSRPRRDSRSLSFSVEPGQTVALVGPSGIGKSTIADLLAAVDRSRRRTGHAGRHRPETAGAARSAPARRAGRSGSRALPRQHRREHSLRAAGRRPTTRSVGRRRLPEWTICWPGSRTGFRRSSASAGRAVGRRAAARRHRTGASRRS